MYLCTLKMNDMDILELALHNQQTAWKILEHTGIIPEIQFKNLIQTEEECIEWHAIYEDEDMNTWKFDMIHIRKGSKYDGVVEKVTVAITNQLTPEIKNTILQIKFDVPDGIQIPGIEIYHAVFVGGVRSYKELEQWRKTNPLTNSLDWLP